MMQRFFTSLFTVVALGSVFILASCHDDDPASSTVLVDSTVLAALGGTFSDDLNQPKVTVTIPAGALSEDAQLTISQLAGTRASFQTDKFQITLTSATGAGVSLNQAMKIALLSDAVPTHPELAEVVNQANTSPQRMPASFYRPASQTVVTLTQETDGVYGVSFRTLQKTEGEAVARGGDVMMNETFGNENFFGGVLGLHTLLNGVDPVTAVSLGVQVDLSKVPQAIVGVMIGTDLAAKDTALADPATTLALLAADAVIGVRAQFDQNGAMTSAGITCALCHVNVEPNEFELSSGLTMLPIGQPQFDGMPNSAIDAGTILSLTPFVQGLADNGATAALLQGWGPGNFDVRALPDNVLDDAVDNPTQNPQIWNFVDLEAQGYSFGWDGLFLNDGSNNNSLASQAEAVFDVVMHANGAFGTAAGTLPPELSVTPPQALLDALALAETNEPGNDVTLDKLLDLQEWMRSITSPAPGAFDEAKAELGFELFHGEAGCSGCHSTADLTGPGLFTAITSPQGDLSGGIHVPGLRGISHTAPYFQDGSATTLEDAIQKLMNNLGQVPLLTVTQQENLVGYLKSL